MTTHTDADSAVTAYLDAVRLYLSDLPEWDREELLSDIEDHVREVAAEWDGSLHSVLGDPITFVEEYRSSAAIPRSRHVDETAPLVDRIVRAVERLRTGRQFRSLVSYLTEARPGWWGLRGYLGASILLYVVASNDHAFLSPWAHGLGGLLTIAAAMWLSIHLGRRSQNRSGRRVIAILINAAVMVGFVAVNSQIGTSDRLAADMERDDSQVAAMYDEGFNDGLAAVALPDGLTITGAPVGIVTENDAAISESAIVDEVAVTTTSIVGSRTFDGDSASAELAGFASCLAESGVTADVTQTSDGVVVSPYGSSAGMHVADRARIVECYTSSGMNLHIR